MINIIIPFRLQSSRFPNKALALFQGKPLIAHTLSIATTLKNLVLPRKSRIVVTSPANDFIEVEPLLRDYDYKYIESSVDCTSGTARVIDIYEALLPEPDRSSHPQKNENHKVIVLPTDEPLIDPSEIRRVFNLYNYTDRPATLCCEFYTKEDAYSKFSAKIVRVGDEDVYDNQLLYMSRAPIPSKKNGGFDIWRSKKNVGVGFFTLGILKAMKEKFSNYTSLDKVEGLEQLKWLEMGFKVNVYNIKHIGFGIDSPEQIKQLENRVKGLDKKAHNEKLIIDIDSMVEVLASRGNHIYLPVETSKYKTWDATRKIANQHIRLDLIDVKDKTVLDLGCNTGYLTFQFIKNGAKRCIGLDFNQHFISIANKALEMENLDTIEFKKWDINTFKKMEDPNVRPVSKWSRVGLDLFDYDPEKHIFDVVTVLSVHDSEWLLSIMPYLLKLGKTFYIEPTNHLGQNPIKNTPKRMATIEEIKTWGLTNLAQWGQVEYVGTTDYQNRGLFKLET